MSALSGLNKWVGRQIRSADDGDMAEYENRVHEARLDERRRIARELHDRLGEVLTVGLRQLDIDEITGPEIPEGQSKIAREVLVEAMRRLRLVTSGLRDEPRTGNSSTASIESRLCLSSARRTVMSYKGIGAPFLFLGNSRSITEANAAAMT
jgi:signal transduction histidine kinase